VLLLSRGFYGLFYMRPIHSLSSHTHAGVCVHQLRVACGVGVDFIQGEVRLQPNQNKTFYLIDFCNVFHPYISNCHATGARVTSQLMISD